MQIGIWGVTGGVGSNLAQVALEKNHRVVGIARNPAKVKIQHPNLIVKSSSSTDIDAMTKALKGCDVAVSTIGGGGFGQMRKPTSVYSDSAKTMLAAMRANGMDRIIAVTAGGIVEQDDWPWYYRNIVHPMLKEMYNDMHRMEDTIKSASVRHLFVRPVGLTDGNRTGIYRTREELTPPKGARISRADVADYILKRIEADDYTSGGIVIAY